MKGYRKFLLVVFSVISIMLIQGCSYSKEYKETREEAIKIAKEYIKDKYNEELVVEGSRVDSKIGLGLPTSPSGAVVLSAKDKAYKVYVDINDGIVADNKQLEEIKNDINKEYFSNEFMNIEHTVLEYEIYGINPYIFAQPSTTGQYMTKEMYYNGNIKEFLKNNDIAINLDIHFKANEEFTEDNFYEKIDIYKQEFDSILTAVIEDFRPNNSYVRFMLYHPEKYMNEDVKAIIESRKTSFSSTDRYVYASDYVYLKAYANDTYEYGDEVEVHNWEKEYVYDKFLEIDEGLYVSSLYDRKFESREDVFYNICPVYLVDDKIIAFDKNILKKVGNKELEVKKVTNKDGQTVLTGVYDIKYNSEVFEDDRRCLDIKIDKERFENGILLDSKNSIGAIYPNSEDESDFRIGSFLKGFIREDDKYVYVTIDDKKQIVVYTQE